MYVNLGIYLKVSLRRNSIQPPPGEPLGEVRQKKVLATQNFIRDKMTERADILWHMFKKMQKVKNEVTGPESIVFGKFLRKRKQTVLFWVLSL